MLLTWAALGLQGAYWEEAVVSSRQRAAVVGMGYRLPNKSLSQDTR